MCVTDFYKRRWLYVWAMTSSFLLFWLLPHLLLAQQEPIQTRIVRTIKPSGVERWRPTSLAFAPARDEFWLINPPPADMANTGAWTTGAPALIRLNRFDEMIAVYSLPSAVTPSAITYDEESGALFLLDASHPQLLALEPTDNRTESGSGPTLRTTVQYTVADWGVMQPAALALDTPNRTLYLLDAGRKQLLMLPLQAGRAALAPTGTPARIELTLRSDASLHGLAFDPRTGNLFTLDANRGVMYEFTPLGALVESYDLAELGLHNPQGMVFAPSSDRTDDPSVVNLFMTESDPSQSGRLVELSLTPLEISVVAASVQRAPLVRTIDLSTFAYPSPDPSGIAYIADSPFVENTNRFLIVDGEVEETALYRGANVFELDLNGTLVQTYTTHLVFSSEPVGAAFNAANGHYFISDDDKRKIHEVDLGPDQRFMTADDTQTVTLVTNFGSIDPEGLAFGLVKGITPTLFIADGVNSEIYRITPGPNGIFGGATADDRVTSFDTATWGVVDPEGIEYNPANGHLYVAGAQPVSGQPSNRIAEFTLSGTLVQFIDTLAANPVKQAGLAIGPSSQNLGAMALYVVDRGIDNNIVPSENDGKVYEFSIPDTNQPPVVDAGPDQNTTAQESISLQGVVTDDGLPILPTTITLLWEKVSGPGAVDFSQAGQALTAATFDTAGSYILRLTADDGELRATDEVTVTVSAANIPPTVNAGSDQSVSLSTGATLDGVVSDDGLPNPPGKVSMEWQQISGPGTASLSNGDQAKTTVSFPLIGVYGFRLTATDGAATAGDEVTITVQANQAPVVELASTRVVTLTQLTDAVSITATIQDDGVPAQLTITWSLVSGRGEVTLANAHSATTSAQFNQAGDYLFQLSVSDGEYTTIKTIVITVVVESGGLSEVKLFVPLVWR